jgi:predicted ATPase
VTCNLEPGTSNFEPETAPKEKTVTTAIRTPDQRLRVFISSTLEELAAERVAVREAITQLRLTPVLFELGARPYPPRDLYRAYLEQSHIFIGIYWQRYGWVAPDMDISGLEDEYRLVGDKPKLIYIKAPAPDREPRLTELINQIRDSGVSYKRFSTPEELRDLVGNDLALLLTERFEEAEAPAPAAHPPDPANEASLRGRNLPIQRSSIIGREREIAAVNALLQREDVSLLTLTGPGGAGKTRLGLQVAADLLDAFRDGVFFVPLTPVTDPSRVAAAIAQVVGVRDSGVRPLEEILKETLRDKQILLLLDNFEHVVGAALLVADLLVACPKLKILVTSRTRLHVRGEKEFPVPPLELPDPRYLPTLERLSQYAAVQLFLQRAADVQPDFTLTAENAPVIAEICQRLDGLPLAIELAAARIKTLSPQALLARLTRRFDILKGGARDLPERQQTLRNTIDWSYNQLDPTAQQLLRRLAVFVGSWTLAAAEALCSIDGDLADVLDVLEVLVDNNLLLRTKSTGEPRYDMLESIREYAHEQLQASGEADTFHQRHSDYFIELVEKAEPHFRGAGRFEWLDRVEDDLDDVRAILARSNSPGALERGLRLAGALNWFWYFRTYLTEGRTWAEGLLAQIPAGTPDSKLQAKLHFGAGALAWTQGDFSAAQAHLEQSIARYRTLGDGADLAYALLFRGNIALVHGDAEDARQRNTEALALLTTAGDRWGTALAHTWLGDALLALGDPAAARTQHEESLARFRQIDDGWGAALPLHALANLAARQGEYATAHDLLEESGARLRAAGDQWGFARSLMGSATVALLQGNAPQAQLLFEVTLSLWHEVGNKLGIVRALAGLAAVASAENPARAATLFGMADALLRTIGVGVEPLATGPLPIELYERGEFRPYLAKVREQLDPTGFAAAWEKGHKTTLDGAVAFVLGES